MGQKSRQRLIERGVTRRIEVQKILAVLDARFAHVVRQDGKSVQHDDAFPSQGMNVGVEFIYRRSNLARPKGPALQGNRADGKDRAQNDGRAQFRRLLLIAHP